MSDEIKRYLIPANGPEIEPITTALTLLAKLCEDSGSPRNAVLLIPTKKQIKGTTLATALGTEKAKILLKGERLRLPGEGNLRLETERTFRGFWNPDIILGVYATKKMLDQIDSAREASAIIVVPWIMDTVMEWKRTWNPETPGEVPSAPEELIKNPVAEEALKTLTQAVNLSTGLLHTSDKEAAVELFRLLRENGEPFDPNSIRAWAVRNNWTPEGADQLRDVAQAILDRRPIRGSRHPHWEPDIIEELRKRVKGH